MQHLLGTNASFQPTMQNAYSESVPDGMHDELVKIVFDNATKTLAKDLGEIVANGTCDKEHIQACAKLTAKVCFDFADAIMRERYERHCVESAKLTANFNRSVEEALKRDFKVNTSQVTPQQNRTVNGNTNLHR